MGDDLKTFLEQNLPRVKAGKKSKYKLGVSDAKIGTTIQEGTNIQCNSNETVHPCHAGAAGPHHPT